MAIVNKMILVMPIGSDPGVSYLPEFFMPPRLRMLKDNLRLAISNGFPEQGGGGASADVDCDGGDSSGAAPEVAASDDDDGGDDDGEPARRSPLKNQSLTFAPALFAFSYLSHYTSFGRSRIYQLIADPVLKFPPPVKIGTSSRWLKTEVDNWLTKQADSRHQVAG